MFEASRASDGYKNSIRSTGTSRGIEYQIFTQVTQQLSNIRKDAPDYAKKRAEALHRNLRLWTILASDVANENNPLPAELRANLFYLAEFIRHYTAKAYNENVDEGILVEINTMVMRGLRTDSKAAGELTT